MLFISHVISQGQSHNALNYPVLWPLINQHVDKASRQEKCLCKGGDCYDDAITIVKIIPVNIAVNMFSMFYYNKQLFVAWQNRKTPVYPGRRQRQTDQ